MTQLFFIVGTFAAAFFLEWGIHGMLFGISFPLVAATTLYWFWNFDLEKRIISAFGIGFLIDMVSPFPFGVHMAVFLFLAYIADMLRNFFSDTSSYAAQVLGIGILVLCFIILVPTVSAVYLYVRFF